MVWMGGEVYFSWNFMTDRFFRFLSLGLLSILSTCTILAAEKTEVADKDSELEALVQEATRLVAQKKPADAVEKCDIVIAAFKAKYEKSKETIYCAQSSTESLAYLLTASQAKKAAKVISQTWAEAYFVRGFAFTDLQKPVEAKRDLVSALALSPYNPHYLCEMGHIFTVERNWGKARELYAAAEEHYGFSPKPKEDLALARRGTGYVLVELGKLAEAEKKYEECLAADPEDRKAKAELEYVRKRRKAEEL